MTWAEEEFAGAELGDKRLNRRLIKLTERFADRADGQHPGGLVPIGENGGNLPVLRPSQQYQAPAGGWEAILSSHMDSTAARMRQHPVALCLQDTTELDFNGQGIEGLGAVVV